MHFYLMYVNGKKRTTYANWSGFHSVGNIYIFGRKQTLKPIVSKGFIQLCTQISLAIMRSGGFDISAIKIWNSLLQCMIDLTGIE